MYAGSPAWNRADKGLSPMIVNQSVAQDLKEIKRLIAHGLEGCRARVYFFGSRARDQASQYSDIDVAILPLEPLPVGLLSTIREAIEESHVPYRVDLVDLSTADPEFRKRVIEEGVIWIEPANERR